MKKMSLVHFAYKMDEMKDSDAKVILDLLRKILVYEALYRLTASYSRSIAFTFKLFLAI